MIWKPANPRFERQALTALWWIMGTATLVFVVLAVIPAVFGWFMDFRSTPGELASRAITYDRELVAGGDDTEWYLRLLKNPWAWGAVLFLAWMQNTFSNR
ncbi:hypothetical protein NT6N_03940 [Oceaniferula spumae]|uniref:ABC transporter permease n=1 Tax=Oceaniferula spumae TaxID=2979115 RepID=A0AAT9FHA9_9BACT